LLSLLRRAAFRLRSPGRRIGLKSAGLTPPGSLAALTGQETKCAWPRKPMPDIYLLAAESSASIRRVRRVRGFDAGATAVTSLECRWLSSPDPSSRRRRRVLRSSWNRSITQAPRCDAWFACRRSRADGPDTMQPAHHVELAQPADRVPIAAMSREFIEYGLG
jgi:hypothetical protein